jgi:hypothetical protein
LYPASEVACTPTARETNTATDDNPVFILVEAFRRSKLAHDQTSRGRVGESGGGKEGPNARYVSGRVVCNSRLTCRCGHIKQRILAAEKKTVLKAEKKRGAEGKQKYPDGREEKNPDGKEERVLEAKKRGAGGYEKNPDGREEKSATAKKKESWKQRRKERQRGKKRS